jgi:hypothetical protein
VEKGKRDVVAPTSAPILPIVKISESVLPNNRTQEWIENVFSQIVPMPVQLMLSVPGPEVAKMCQRMQCIKRYCCSRSYFQRRSS